ncbi:MULTISPECIES: phage tail tape measure protein [unclassified Aeromicrobium]|jgi:TP901 family phage tail tape measure protein|uniref:phage tail tape measure protein n=1 Tax=unclassified Aeromicrobium TaxID=2633570 RepID=UPI000AEC090E|nr:MULTISPECIES: phage tail tape measure protein [unclassified Aeromicrobium]
MSDRKVTVLVTADMSQYRTAMQQASRDTAALGVQGQRSGGQVSSALKIAAGSVATVGIAKLVKDSVQLEAAYSRTMRQVAQQTKAPKAAMAELDDLAMKLGADTVFSAQESASAMLELAKGGLSPAQIQAGALKNSLTLAAAGSLDLDVAANSVVNTMGAFRLEASQTDEAVSALAGAANASSADVSDITQALAQAGTEANSASLSVQETTGILAAFWNAGIQGSDAGTSLRTMLTRLVPQTKEQAQAMAELGLTFTDSNGEFVSATQIAERLQRTFGGMSAKERTAALTTIFGADARRAANVLIQEGAEGLEGYIRQTSDLGAAQRLADASMSGTSGALENLSGQIETAKIQFGKGLAPAIVEVADRLSDLAADGDFEEWGRKAGDAAVWLVDTLGPAAESTLPAVATTMGIAADAAEALAPAVKAVADAFNAMPEWAQTALVTGAFARYAVPKVLPGAAGAAAAGAGASAAGSAAGGAARGTALGAVSKTALGRSAGVIGIAGILGEIYNDKLLESLPKRYEDLRQSAMTANEKQRETLELRNQIFGEDLGGGGGTRGALWQFEDLGERTRLASAGLGKYADELIKLPAEVTTRIATPGAVKSIEDVVALSRQYGLTPEEVETIMRAKDFATRDIQEAIGYLYSVDGDSATLKVDANTQAARQAVGGLLSFANSLPGISIPIQPAAATGGVVPQGFASGGVVPGRPPSNPMLDNVIARGPAGKTLMVRSGEWIINERSSRENDEWLAAINAGLNLSDLLGDVPGFASGGQVDAVSSLELTRLRIRMRDLQRSLNEREKYGEKPKGKDTRPTRYVLRGLDRVEARQDLIETRREYAGTLRASRDARRRGMSPDQYNEYRDNRAEQRRQLREDRRQATDSFISSNTSIEGLSTPEQVERALDRSIADMATLTSLLFQLKKHGAAPWLLQQLQAAGPSKSAIKLARHYLSDANALRRVNAQVPTLQGVAGAYGQLTTDPAWMAARGWSGNLSAAQRQQVTKLEQTVTMKFDETSLAREVARLVQHNLDAGQQRVGVLG